MKERCAREALKYIKDGMVVGLGGGSTISYLVAYIADRGLDVSVVTPSYQTATLCLEHQLPVLPTWVVDHVDIAFDGCDEVDLELNALKSGGAIHTKEKIIAQMADDYVLLVDETKVYEKLPFNKSVAVEVIPEAKAFVTKQLTALGVEVKMRTSAAKDGYTISDQGNFILDAYFKDVADIRALAEALHKIAGIVETSLFVDEVSFVLSVDDLSVRIIK